MNGSRIIKLSARDKLRWTLIGIGLALAVIAFSIVLFAFVLPWMNGTPRLSPAEISDRVAQQQQDVHAFWADKKGWIYSALDWLGVLFLIAVGLWCLKKVFGYFCARLDKQGHWDQAVVQRKDPRDHWT